MTTEEQFAEAWAGYLRTQGVGGMLDVGPEEYIAEHDAAWWAWQVATLKERGRCLDVAREHGESAAAINFVPARAACESIAAAIANPEHPPLSWPFNLGRKGDPK